MYSFEPVTSFRSLKIDVSMTDIIKGILSQHGLTAVFLFRDASKGFQERSACSTSALRHTRTPTTYLNPSLINLLLSLPGLRHLLSHTIPFLRVTTAMAIQNFRVKTASGLCLRLIATWTWIGFAAACMIACTRRVAARRWYTITSYTFASIPDVIQLTFASRALYRYH